MEGGVPTVRWRSPPIPGVPNELLQRADALQGAYVNSGRMSGSLARLQIVHSLLSHASSRNKKEMDRTRATISRVLSSMHSNIQAKLGTTRSRMDAELEEFKARMDGQLLDIQEQVDRQVQGGIADVQAALQDGSVMFVVGTARNGTELAHVAGTATLRATAA
ncbi:hypothetical protein CF326_g1962 [Tilletia indica]|nr:hypothetical protein CF326_g1962 [Tilletia indica]